MGPLASDCQPVSDRQLSGTPPFPARTWGGWLVLMRPRFETGLFPAEGGNLDFPWAPLLLKPRAGTPRTLKKVHGVPAFFWHDFSALGRFAQVCLAGTIPPNSKALRSGCFRLVQNGSVRPLPANSWGRVARLLRAVHCASLENLFQEQELDSASRATWSELVLPGVQHGGTVTFS